MSEHNMDGLVDVRQVRIDRSLPREERIRSFVRQVKNPYRFRVGKVIVNVSYANCGSTLNDRFTEMLSLLE